MKTKNKGLEAFLNKVPGKKYFGIYRFLPLFFLLGASLEFAMINWHIKCIKEEEFKKLSKKVLHRSNLSDQKPSGSIRSVNKLTSLKKFAAMPAGVSWPTYLKFAFAAFLTMFAGAQVIHVYYRPLQDLDQLVEAERQKVLTAASNNDKNVIDR